MLNASAIRVRYLDGKTISFKDVVFHSIDYNNSMLLIRQEKDGKKKSHLLNMVTIADVEFEDW